MGLCDARRGSPGVGVILAAAVATPSRADVYYTRDASGAMHFSNVPTKDARLFLAAPPAIAPLREPADTSPAFGKAIGAGAYDDLIGLYSVRYGVEPAS